MKNFITILLLLLTSQVRGQDKFIAHRESFDIYLVDNSIKSVDYGSYSQAWFKMMPTKGKEAQFKNAEIANRKKGGLSIKGFQSYAYSMILIKSNCRNNQMATIEAIYYSTNGDIIDSHKTPYDEWDNVVPNSLGEALNNTICNN